MKPPQKIPIYGSALSHCTYIESSLIEFEVSVIELKSSVIELESSVIKLESSINPLSYSFKVKLI